MKIYEKLVETLFHRGVRVMFGLMGDGNMRYVANYRDAGGRFVSVAHENSAVAMADSFSRMTGSTGVATVTHGPALSNTVNALTEAARNRSRVLVITADPPPEPSHPQRVDMAAVAAAAGAGYDRVYGAHSIARDLHRAFQRVLAERRPVVLDVPVALLMEVVAEQLPMEAAMSPGAMVPTRDRVDEAVAVIVGAQRPVILAGRGAVAAGAHDSLLALSERIAAPLATSALAKDLFRGDPRNLGLCGGLAHSAALRVLAEADCIIAFGAALNDWTTFHGSLARGKKVVQVDCDVAAFGRSTPVDSAVPGDARHVADALVEALDLLGHRRDRSWLGRVQLSLADHRLADDFQDRSVDGAVDIRSAAMRLDEILPSGRVVVSDVGRFLVGVWPYLSVTRPQNFAYMGAYASIGLGLAGAIGSAIARPGELTVGIAGDGGFMMHLSELTTAVREKLPMLMIVFNDGAYGAEHHKLVRHGMNADYALNAWPDLVPVARAMGADGLTVRCLQDLNVLTEVVGSLDGPFVVDVRLDPLMNVMPPPADTRAVDPEMKG